mmetsp:Transcript_56378/g.68938  ORF Transcript_56378/g.68938 Transcript_56378/m.68938 type:complete len:351 (-) Transcript_56378:120-1172(-)
MLSKLVLGACLLFGINGLSWRDEITMKDLKKVGTFKAFQEWQNEYDITYESMDIESKKYLVWLDNLNTIAKINTQQLSYTLRANQFTDLTSEEFRYAVHGKDGSCFKPNELFDYENANIIELDESKPVNAPSSVDWRTKGVVTPVKNQGQCGSCWSFSATGALECNYAIKTGKLTSLSEQQLVDCAGSKYGCYGCNGGQMTGAMEYAANEGGLCSESEYRYTARNGQCKASSCGTKYDANTGYNPVTRDSEPSMVTATVAGCVSIGIEADQTAFQHYSGGVLTGTCGTRIDHGVLIVGYGTQSGQEYWLVKNSWGTSWGEQGYVKICRNCNKNNGQGECGILKEGNVPTY